MTGNQTREERAGEKDRHLLVAVDGTEGSDRTVLYVADFCGGIKGFRVTLFHVVTVPPEEHFSDADERRRWVSGREEEAGRFLTRYRDLLIQAGFPPDKVEILFLATDREPVAEVILKKHGEIGSCTIVLGRAGKSRQEEFLFGSVSSRIVHQAKGCSVWVIE